MGARGKTVKMQNSYKKRVRIKTCWDPVAPVKDGEESYHEAFANIEDVSLCARKDFEVDNNISINITKPPPPTIE